MTDSLRAKVDAIIDQHFEPSVMGRVQAVDEIMELFKPYLASLQSVAPQAFQLLEPKVVVSDPVLDEDIPEDLFGPPPAGGDVKFAEPVAIQMVTTGQPARDAERLQILIEEERFRQQRRGGW